MVSEVNVLLKQLNRQKKLKDGSLKMLKNPNITASVRTQAQMEMTSCCDNIREIEMKLTLANRLKEIKKKNKNDTFKLLDIVVHENPTAEEVSKEGIEMQLLLRINDLMNNPIDQIELTNKLVIKLQTRGDVEPVCFIPLDISKECIINLLRSNYYQIRICGIRILRFSIDYSKDLNLIGDLEELLIKCLKDPNIGDFNEMINLLRDFIDSGKLSNLTEGILIQTRKTFQHIISNGSFNIGLIICVIEISCEICLLEPILGFSMRFLNLVMHTLLEPPYPSGLNVSRDIKTMQLPLILKFIDDEELFDYLEEIGFIPILISQLIDSNLNSSLQHNHILLSKRMIHIGDIFCRIMRSERGIKVFMDNDYKYFKMVINGLYSESSIIKNSVMGVLANGLKIRKLIIGWGSDWYDDILEWEKLLIDNKGGNEIAKLKFNGRSASEIEDPIVKEQVKVVLSACFECQVPKVLMEVYENLNVSNEKKLGKRFILLLSEMIYLKGVLLLPEGGGGYKNIEMGFKMNNLVERELKKHMKFNEKGKTVSDNYEGLSFDEMDIKPSTIVSLGIDFGGDALINRVDNRTIIHKLRQQSIEIDYKGILNASHVLSTKDHNEWDWEMITVLVRGLLWNSRVLEETLKTTKFFKRLISFFNPIKSGGSSFLLGYTKVGLWTLEVLIWNDDGVDMLRGSGMMEGLKYSIVNGGGDSDDGISIGVINLVGGLTKWVNGLRLLEEFGIVGELFKVSDERSVLGLIESIDFNVAGQLRVLMGKWCKLSGLSLEVKIRCVERVSREYLLGLKDYSVKYWGCSVLLEGLASGEVFLRRMCEEKLVEFIEGGEGTTNLNVLLSLGVNLRVLGGDSQLVYQVLKYPIGVEYYYQRWPDYVESMILAWWGERGVLAYSRSINTYALLNDARPQRVFNIVDSLAETEEGSRLLSRFVAFPTK